MNQQNSTTGSTTKTVRRDDPATRKCEKCGTHDYLRVFRDSYGFSKQVICIACLKEEEEMNQKDFLERQIEKEIQEEGDKHDLEAIPTNDDKRNMKNKRIPCATCAHLRHVGIAHRFLSNTSLQVPYRLYNCMAARQGKPVLYYAQHDNPDVRGGFSEDTMYWHCCRGYSKGNEKSCPSHEERRGKHS